MSHDILERLQELCAKLREKLMANPDYRALVTLERTIQELTICLDAVDLKDTALANPKTPDVSMQHGAETMAGRIADALRERKPSQAAAHLPSHRMA